MATWMCSCHKLQVTFSFKTTNKRTKHKYTNLKVVCFLLFFISGNLMEPPTAFKKSGTFSKVEKKTIRGRGYDSDSEDD